MFSNKKVGGSDILSNAVSGNPASNTTLLQGGVHYEDLDEFEDRDDLEELDDDEDDDGLDRKRKFKKKQRNQTLNKNDKSNNKNKKNMNNISKLQKTLGGPYPIVAPGIAFLTSFKCSTPGLGIDPIKKISSVKLRYAHFKHSDWSKKIQQPSNLWPML